MRFRERFQRFMYGRYGMDGLGQFLLWTAVACMLFSWFVDGPVFSTLAMVLLILGYFRMFSRNVQKRYQENCTYYHSLLVTGADESGYLVAAHSDDAFGRPLAE